MAEGKERYAIVKVNWICPTKYNEKIDCKFVCENKDVIKNEQCEKCRYGDTKEQLIRKVAQVRLKQKIKRWYAPFLEPSKLTIEFVYEKCLEEAKEIVEFLGVK